MARNRYPGHPPRNENSVVEYTLKNHNQGSREGVQEWYSIYVSHSTCSTYATPYSRTRFPPVFHEWFLETFTEPSAWLAIRLSFSRTAAVMSMVGFILGYDPRSAWEQIFLTDIDWIFQVGRQTLRKYSTRSQQRRRSARRLQLSLWKGCQLFY